MLNFDKKLWGIRVRKIILISLVLPLLSSLPVSSAAISATDAPSLKATPTATNLVTAGLVARFDSRNPNSYPGTGSVWTSLSSGGGSATLYNSLTTTSQNAGGSTVPVMTFAADNKYADINSDLNNFSSGFSASFYANFGTAQSWERIFDIGAGQANNNIFVAREGTTNNFIFDILDGSIARRCMITNGISNSTWNHWAVTYNGSSCTIYKDGVSQAITTSGAATIQNVTRANGYIGRSNWSADSYFEGYISDIAFYNGILSASDVAINWISRSWESLVYKFCETFERV